MYLIKVILKLIYRFTIGPWVHSRLQRFFDQSSNNISGSKMLWRFFRLGLSKILVKMASKMFSVKCRIAASILAFESVWKFGIWIFWSMVEIYFDQLILAFGLWVRVMSKMSGLWPKICGKKGRLAQLPYSQLVERFGRVLPESFTQRLCHSGCFAFMSLTMMNQSQPCVNTSRSAVNNG